MSDSRPRGWDYTLNRDRDRDQDQDLLKLGEELCGLDMRDPDPGVLTLTQGS